MIWGLGLISDDPSLMTFCFWRANNATSPPWFLYIMSCSFCTVTNTPPGLENRMVMFSD